MFRTQSERPAVVLVDDDPGVLRALERLFRDEPYDALATLDPLEALAWCSRRDVRAVVVDQRMPQISGTELLGWVRARYPSMPCVILTGYADTALVIERDHLRIERLVLKPWDDENLREMLRELAGFGRKPSASTALSIDCEGQTDAEVISRILPELVLARDGGKELLLYIDHLVRLKGPLARFVLSLVRLAAEKGVRILLRDGSGLASTVIEAIGNFSPYVMVQRSEKPRDK